MKALFINITFILSIVFAIKSYAAKPCVILLHGLGQTHHAMSGLANYLELNNYIVVNIDYPSTKKPIKELAKSHISLMLKECLKHNPKNINFVTHSLGGVVLREFLHSHNLSNIGAIVMLAPPNHGSEIADLLQHNFLFKILLGPAAQELTTAKNSTPNSLPNSLPYPLGIIAGNFNFNIINKLIFHGENDGKVSTSSTQMNNMKDFIILPVSHIFMFRNKLVKKQVLNFLEHRQFLHQNE